MSKGWLVLVSIFFDSIQQNNMIARHQDFLNQRDLDDPTPNSITMRVIDGLRTKLVFQVSQVRIRKWNLTFSL